MIQRVQTIYLALAFICMVLLLFFPIFGIEMTSVSGDVNFMAEFGKNGIVGEGFEEGNLPVSYIYIGLALLTFATLLMYKKRPRQLLLCRLNLILHVVFVLGVYAFYYFGKSFIQEGIKNTLGEDTTVAFSMEIGFFFLIPTIAFLYLAIRGIKRDENLINSLDRLR